MFILGDSTCTTTKLQDKLQGKLLSVTAPLVSKGLVSHSRAGGVKHPADRMSRIERNAKNRKGMRKNPNMISSFLKYQNDLTMSYE